MKKAAAIVAAVSLWMATTALAHRLDEYLQATIVSVEPGNVRLEMNLTPGVAVAEQVLAQVDRDHDGVISKTEATAYAEALQHDLIVQMDERHLTLKLTAFNFPDLAELRDGSGIIQMEFSAAPGSLSAGAHRLSVQNRHLPGISVYLFNAAQPKFFAASSPKTGLIEITAQKRNENQSNGEINFTYHPPPRSYKDIGLIAPLILVFAVLGGIRLMRMS